jgi:transcription initiation factor TFIID subunit TAF12
LTLNTFNRLDGTVNERILVNYKKQGETTDYQKLLAYTDDIDKVLEDSKQYTNNQMAASQIWLSSV